MNTRRVRRTWSGLLVCLVVSVPAWASDVAKKKDFVSVSQEKISGYHCTACSTYNMLANGNEAYRKIADALPGATAEDRVRHIMDKYGSGPSVVYPNRARFSEKTGGVTAEDMKGMVNECLQDFGQKPLAADYLERKENETPAQHLRRVHALLRDSLKKGVPPIVNVRAYVAVQDEKNKDDFLWNGLSGHSVAIVDVDKELRDGDKGFRFWYAESDNGTTKGSVESGYASVEELRPYTAPRALTVEGEDTLKWEWLPNSPFLQVTAPSLSLKTHAQPKFRRTVIVLRHAVYAEK